MIAARRPHAKRRSTSLYDSDAATASRASSSVYLGIDEH